MRIGILVSMSNNFGEKGFYNSQEMGLAKALISLENEVWIWKFIKKGISVPEDVNINLLHIKYYSSIAFGASVLVDVERFDERLDALFYFSDTQLSVSKVYNWCRRNRVIFIPYIGVAESHSNNVFVRKIMNTLFIRNLMVYRKTVCVVKNRDVKSRLERKGIKNIYIAPVGIDIDLLKADYNAVSNEQIKEKLGYAITDRVLLFVGRLVGEKRPLYMIEIFRKLKQTDNRYKLLIIGDGELKRDLKDAIKTSGYECDIQHIEKVPNERMWEFYRLSECLINLNMQEIFGMVILEAMFYETKVIAWHAPGPDTIINSGEDGYLISNEGQLLSAVVSENRDLGKNAHERVVNNFTWPSSAKVFMDVTNSQLESV